MRSFIVTVLFALFLVLCLAKCTIHVLVGIQEDRSYVVHPSVEGVLLPE